MEPWLIGPEPMELQSIEILPMGPQAIVSLSYGALAYGASAYRGLVYSSLTSKV